MALMLPSAMCTLDDGPLVEAGRRLQACEDRVAHLTAEIKRLQLQQSVLQRAHGESTHGGRDGLIGGGVRAATPYEWPAGIVTTPEDSVEREARDDANRRRQDVAGRVMLSFTVGFE
jgi:hypothetical protein